MTGAPLIPMRARHLSPEAPMTGTVSRRRPLDHQVARPVFVGVVLLLAGAMQVEAQGTSITACYPKPAKNGTPGSGVVYRINKPAGSAPSAPSACSTGDIEFAWDQIGPIGPAGPVGPAGAAGANGAPGPEGPSGVSGYVFQQDIYVSIPAGLSSKAMYCPGGKSVLSGGYRVEGADPAVHIVWDTPIDGGPGWYWRIQNESGGATPVSFYTLCASLTP